MSKVSKHTEGPWVIIPAREYDGDDDELQGSYVSPAHIEGSDGSPVCAFGIAEGSGTLFENEADYHLIAAAPDMLEALKVMVREELDRAAVTIPPCDPEQYQHMMLARVAIAKAEGRQ